MRGAGKITGIKFAPWEEHDIMPNLRRGWPARIRHIAAFHFERPPVIDGAMSDPIWNNAEFAELKVPFYHDSAWVSTKVALAWDIEFLYAGIRADLPDMPVQQGSADERARMAEEKVTIAIDRNHDHGEMQSFTVNALGGIEWFDNRMMRAGFSDELGFQFKNFMLKDFNPDPSSMAGKMGIRGAAQHGPGGWTAELAIPLKTLNAEGPLPGRTMGLEIIRTATERPVEKFNYHFTWSEQSPGILGSPPKMGVMSFGPEQVMLESIDFPNCSWGINHASCMLRNETRRTIKAMLISRGRGGHQAGGGDYANEPVSTGPVEIQAGQSVSTAFEYHMPVRFMPRIIELEVRDDENGDRLMSTSYHLGTCPVVYPFGQEQGMPPPSADDPDFIEKRMRYIVSRQPLLRRRTTRQGAPSDFYVEAVDGSVAFDLMKDNVMQSIADWICSLYDNDIDRLIGAAFFMAQQAVYVYSSRRAVFSVMIEPLSNLRLGGGMCGEFARSLVGLLSLMTSVETGRRFQSRIMGVGAHTVAVARKFDRWVVLDPTTCNVKAYFHRDNKTLASGQDLRSDPALLMYNGSTIDRFINPLLTQGIVCGNIWPDGAPGM